MPRAILVTCLLGWGLLAAALPAPADTLAERQEAARLNPSSAEHWDRLGQALAREQRFSEAQDAYARALKLSPGARHIRYHIALAHAWSRDYAAAERMYATLLAEYPHDHDIRIDYGQTLAWDRKYPEARREYQQVLAAMPDHVEALRHLAILTAWEGQYDEALTLLTHAEKVSPKNVRVLLAKGEVLSWKGDLKAAADHLARALAQAPNDDGIWLQLGQIQMWDGRMRDAIDSYRHALGLAPQDLEAYLGLARAYRENRQFTEAERVLRQALDRFPSEARIGKELAALAASRQLEAHDIVEWLEPVLFGAILIIIFIHVRRYRRLLIQRHRTVRGLLYLLPLVAGTSILIGLMQLFGTRYHREMSLISGLLEVLTLLILIVVISMLVWLLRIERPSRQRVILAIGAHPDDIEFGCGATLLRYREQGDTTHALILTGGEKGYDSRQKPAQRVQEAEAGAHYLGLSSITVHALPDTHLSTVREELRELIEARVKALKPDIIFTHTLHDTHSDHQAVADATREAVRDACTILCYENPNTPPDFQPDFFVEITHYVEDKIAAIGLHRSQSAKPYTNPDVIRSAGAFRGTQARVKYAEAFETVRVVDKSDVG